MTICSIKGCGREASVQYEAETGAQYVIVGRFATGPARGEMCTECAQKVVYADGLHSVVLRYGSSIVVKPLLSDMGPESALVKELHRAACGHTTPWVRFCAMVDAAREYAFQVSGLRAKCAALDSKETG